MLIPLIVALSGADALLETHVAGVVVHDDRRDVVVVVEAVETGVLVDPEHVPLVDEHVAVVVELGDVRDEDVTILPSRAQLLGHCRHAALVAAAVAQQEDAGEPLRGEADRHVAQHRLVRLL